MAKTLLVSLVSDQTIPNVQIIKEFNKEVSRCLFITTEGMEKKGTRKWIEKTCGIAEGKRDFIIVKEFSLLDIESKLNSFDFDLYDRIIVNLTGGTKTMTLVASEFFKRVGSEIYYVTGKENEFVRLFPQRKNNVLSFNEQITLSDYLTAYGFTVSKSEASGIPFEQTEALFHKFCKLDLREYRNELAFLSEKRNDKKSVKPEDYHNVSRFIEALGFTSKEQECLSKKEVRYLTGEWFEEYIGHVIQCELDIPEENIMIGTTLTKEIPSKVRNSVIELLGEEPGNDPNNEMDVMFIHRGTFYSIECKSSIVAYKVIKKKGEVKDKEYNILGETLYKSDSLKNRFGLYPKTTIMTLTNFVDYCASSDTQIHHNRIKDMEDLINRANLSNIKLVDANMLLKSDSLFELIK